MNRDYSTNPQAYADIIRNTNAKYYSEHIMDIWESTFLKTLNTFIILEYSNPDCQVSSIGCITC